MSINLDKPHLWKADIAASVDLFNSWFLKFAPKAYRDTRVKTTHAVESTLKLTDDLRNIDPTVLKTNPGILSTLRMSTCPPIARDRLIGLSYASKNLVLKMEEEKRTPVRMTSTDLDENLGRIVATITKLLDRDIFPWLSGASRPGKEERYRASTIVADRLCGAVSDPIIRNAQEQRQLSLIEGFLKERGYRKSGPPPGKTIREMAPGTFAFRTNAVVGDKSHSINIPIDVVVQPKHPSKDRVPILIEAKSAGDFTNVNKRRKEEATKMRQLKTSYGARTRFVLFLCGYFDSGYLGYEAAEGIDWIWEHRIEDLDKLGL
ncbi:MAG: XamI family restriction endonuclease [Candidatus Eisenbacteria bacterium]|nr:XamI family restriction endonuclease [Candidatus Eisenbacteria bacterium]